MVTDNIKNRHLYANMHKYFAEALDILASLTPDSPKGKIVIEEGKAWVNVSRIGESADKIDPAFEAHGAFIDIHYLENGSEIFGYGNLADLEVTEEFDPARDVLFAKGHINEIKLCPREFIITFPDDAHIPNMRKLTDGEVVRAIAKIAVDC